MNKDLVSIIIPIYNVEPFLKQCIINIIAKNTLFLIFFQSLFLFITKWIKLSNIIQNFSIFGQFIFVLLYSGLIYIVSYVIILVLQKLHFDIVLGKYQKRGQL